MPITVVTVWAHYSRVIEDNQIMQGLMLICAQNTIHIIRKKKK